MPTYRYQPYYQYSGPTHSQPLREELAAEEVGRRLGLFFDEIGSYFEEVGAEIETAGTGVVSITTPTTQADCDARVKKCLNSLDLYARRITGGS